jgi:hypothetical protein
MALSGGQRQGEVPSRASGEEQRDVSGGACRDRTDDPLLAKQMLSQLS